MANPEYMHAREIGLRANAIEPSACVGNGACCTSEVPLTKGDVGIIERDIRHGRISREVVNAAIARSQDPERSEQCPFLDFENRCSIYESRPLICIVWGIGGAPSPAGHIDLGNLVEETGPGRIRNMDLEQATCFQCRLMTAFDTTSVEANELAREASLQTEPVLIKRGREYTTAEFVRKDLPFI